MKKKDSQKKGRKSFIPKKATKGLSEEKKKIPKIEKPSDKKWKFSFQNWEQRDLFGLNHEKVSKQWFVDLLERLRDLSSLSINSVEFNA